MNAYDSTALTRDVIMEAVVASYNMESKQIEIPLSFYGPMVGLLHMAAQVLRSMGEPFEKAEITLATGEKMTGAVFLAYLEATLQVASEKGPQID